MKYARAWILTLLISATANAAPEPQRAGMRPIHPPASTSNEPRYVGVEFPAGACVEDVAAATEALHVDCDASPTVELCLEWDAQLMITSDQKTCVCFAMGEASYITIADPTGDGGCAITDADGPDGLGACELIEADQTRWLSPAYSIVRSRAGSRDGLCSVGTSTTNSFGMSRPGVTPSATSGLRYPCNDAIECTNTVGSGTCSSLASLSADQAASDRYSQSCAWVYVRPADAAVIDWTVVR